MSSYTIAHRYMFKVLTGWCDAASGVAYTAEQQAVRDAIETDFDAAAGTVLALIADPLVSAGVGLNDPAFTCS